MLGHLEAAAACHASGSRPPALRNEWFQFDDLAILACNPKLHIFRIHILHSRLEDALTSHGLQASSSFPLGQRACTDCPDCKPWLSVERR